MSLIEKQSETFGFLYLGEGATISRVPLLNILVSETNIPVAVLELVDCQAHLAYGRINNGTFKCNRFLDHFKRIDLHKSITDVIMFGGA